MNRFQDKIVIVTGAAKGIGKAIAKGYFQEGAKVALVDWNQEKLFETEKELRNFGGELLAVRCDLSRPEEIASMVEQVAAHFGTVDILINNAGISRFVSPYEITVEEWDLILNTNLRGAFFCARETAKVMKQNGGGSIVNIASTRALMSEPHSEAYGASKAGLIGLTHALAISFAPDRIRVNAISPGWIETGAYDELREIDHLQHPAGRVGKPEDIVKACFYLTDPENDFVTGINLVVDGGMTRKMIYEE